LRGACCAAIHAAAYPLAAAKAAIPDAAVAWTRPCLPGFTPGSLPPTLSHIARHAWETYGPPLDMSPPPPYARSPLPGKRLSRQEVRAACTLRGGISCKPNPAIQLLLSGGTGRSLATPCKQPAAHQRLAHALHAANPKHTLSVKDSNGAEHTMQCGTRMGRALRHSPQQHAAARDASAMLNVQPYSHRVSFQVSVAHPAASISDHQPLPVLLLIPLHQLHAR
jgi:hypothetical protein